MKQTIRLLVTGTLAALIALPAAAYDSKTWVLRAGIGMVEPKSHNFNLGSLDLGGGISLTSATVEVDSATSLTFSGTYMFTKHWGLDFLAAAPFEHDIDVAATISDGGTTESGRVKIGEVEQVPPTVSLQYHFAADATIQPYIGLGVNYTTFSGHKLTSEAQDAGILAMKLDDSVGVAAQIGLDWMLGDNWLVNVDVRWIDIEADATLTIDDGTGPVTGEIGGIQIDPWTYCLDVGYRF